MTRHVLEALRAAGVPRRDPCFQKATVFVERCQNYPGVESSGDGGLFFSTVLVDANKAGASRDGSRSYGTATADGLLSLLACGRMPDDPRVTAALRWLEEHHRADVAPGFEDGVRQRWSQGLRFYYAASASEAFRRAKAQPDFEVAKELVKLQREDGSWSNSENIVKENDPLIATSFAIRALTATGLT